MEARRYNNPHLDLNRYARHTDTFEPDPHNKPITGDALLFGFFIVGVVLLIWVWCGLARIRMKQTEGRVFFDKHSGYRIHEDKKNKVVK